MNPQLTLGAAGVMWHAERLMQDSPDPGVLLHPDGAPLTIRDLVRIIGVDKRVVERYVNELREEGVLVYTRHWPLRHQILSPDVLYSPELVTLAEIRAEMRATREARS